MRIDFAIINGRPCRVTGWTTEAELSGADCSYGYGQTLAEAGGVYVGEKDVYSVHLGWLSAAIGAGIAGAMLLAVAATANMPQNFCSPRNPGCVPAGWVAEADCPKGSRDCFPRDRVGDRGSGRPLLALMAAGLWV